MMFLEPRSVPVMLNVEAGLEESGDGVSSGNHTIEARNRILHSSVKEVQNLIGNEMITWPFSD